LRFAHETGVGGAAGLLDLAADVSEVLRDGDELEAVLRAQSARRGPAGAAAAHATAAHVRQHDLGGGGANPSAALFASGALAAPFNPTLSGAYGGGGGTGGGSGAIHPYGAGPIPAAEAFRVQRSVLANWINFRVAPRRCFVGHLFTDLADGWILKHLLEVDADTKGPVGWCWGR